MAGSKENSGKRYDQERAARILVDAVLLGDKTAADRHQVCEKTIQRYRQRRIKDPKLSARVRELGAEAEQNWHFARARFLRRTLQKLEALVDAATVEQFKDVIEAVKAVGELELATEALGVGSRDHQSSSPASEDEAGSSAEEADEEAE